MSLRPVADLVRVAGVVEQTRVEVQHDRRACVYLRRSTENTFAYQSSSLGGASASAAPDPVINSEQLGGAAQDHGLTRPQFPHPFP
jgi:hypothetical protein